jgi:hypothetical protein
LEGVTSPCYPTRCKEKGSKRTFNDLTGTLLDGSKRSVRHWILATFLLCLVCSSRRIARELGVHIRTGYRWCWWRRNAALSYEMESRLEGTVEADDLYLTGQNINPDPFLIDIEQPLTRRNLINLAHFLSKQSKDFDLHLVETFNEVVNLILHEKTDPVNPFEELEHPT